MRANHKKMLRIKMQLITICSLTETCQLSVRTVSELRNRFQF